MGKQWLILFFLGSRITADGDCSHEIKRRLLLGSKIMTHLDSIFGEGNGNPLQCSCLENPRDREAWWATVYGVAQSQTRLKRLSSSRFVIAFLPRSKRLLISWLQLPSAVILGPKERKSITISIVSHLFAMKWWDQMPWSLFFECWVLSQLSHSPLSPSSWGSLVPLCFLPYRGCHLHIWGYWYFSQRLWF